MEPNNDHVICPKCVHQFRAIPVNVQEEIASLREQLSNMMAVVASVEKERDELLKDLEFQTDARIQDAKDAEANCKAWSDRQLAAMTKERDELVLALEWYRDNAYYSQQAERANVVLAKVGEKL